ncbi:HAMP domain-containing histidine kinase [bacterium]|nr:HAMP domain-containing histidine kinase [bacterium]
MSKLKNKNPNKQEEYIIKIIHDLKTPINAQIKALESFLTTTKDKITQEEKDLIELTLNSCNYMQKLIETFTSINKLNTENLLLNYEKFDIVELVSSSINELKILLKYYELNIIFDSTKEIIVNADKLQIKRVIENLLSNSINYAYKNTNIEIYLTKKNNNICFEIKNKSPYIEADVLNEIFEKYKTYPLNYNKNGVGLGLYLSKEIIKAHFGKMSAKSLNDNINIFSFSIPID